MHEEGKSSVFIIQLCRIEEQITCRETIRGICSNLWMEIQEDPNFVLLVGAEVTLVHSAHLFDTHHTWLRQWCSRHHGWLQLFILLHDEHSNYSFFSIWGAQGFNLYWLQLFKTYDWVLCSYKYTTLYNLRGWRVWTIDTRCGEGVRDNDSGRPAVKQYSFRSWNSRNYYFVGAVG